MMVIKGLRVDGGADEARARLRSAAEDADVAKARGCSGVGLACCRARSVVARARPPQPGHGGALCHERA